MARRKLSIEDQLRGVKAALKSKRTPPQFITGLRKRAEDRECFGQDPENYEGEEEDGSEKTEH